MTYRTFEQDLPYLLGKFRNPSFDPATGLDNETIRRDIGLLARELAGEPRPVVKARAFEYVTRNVRIDVNPHDWFVGFGCWDRDARPLTALIYGWSEEADRASPELTELRKLCERTGATAIWKDFDHSVPDWEAVYELGFPGLLDRVSYSMYGFGPLVVWFGFTPAKLERGTAGNSTSIFGFAL